MKNKSQNNESKSYKPHSKGFSIKKKASNIFIEFNPQIDPNKNKDVKNLKEFTKNQPVKLVEINGKKFIRRRTIEEIQNLKGIYELRLANIENELSKKNDENLLNLKKDYEKIIDDLIEEHTSEIETLKKEMEDLQEEIKKGSSKSYKPKKYNKGTYKSEMSKEETKSYYEIKMKDATDKYRYNKNTYELSDNEDSKLQEVLPFEYEIDRTSTKNLANLVNKQEIENAKKPETKLRGAKKIEIEIEKKVITNESEDELEQQLREEEERKEKEKKKEEERLERERKKEEERIAREKEKQERERQKEEERKERERKKEEERIAREKEKQERERKKEEERIAREKEKQERERLKSKNINGLSIEKNSSNSSSNNEINKKNNVLLSPSSLEETKDSPMKNTYNRSIAPENTNGKKLNFTSNNLSKEEISKANLKRPNKFNDKSIEGSQKRTSSASHGISNMSMQYFIDNLMNIYNNIEKYDVEKVLEDSEFTNIYNKVKDENYDFKTNLFFPNLKDLHVNAGTFDKVNHKHTVSMSGMNDLLLNIESPETIYKYYESKV